MNQDQNMNVNELKAEGKAEALANEPRCQESDAPLFLRDGSEGSKCDPQDEKNKSSE